MRSQPSFVRQPARRVVAGLGAGLVAAILGSSSAVGVETGGAKPARVHVDSRLLEEAIVEANRELLREQPLRARAALDRAAEACRRVSPDEEAIYGSELANFDRAFHLTLDQAREDATAERIDDAFNQLVWVQRSCLSCHRIARKAGLIVALPSTGPDSGGGAPALERTK